ncbi:MAG: hypothetical protein JWR19_1755 [Pedosphaera sp.]|nr:hypothetical protein [Pedosphaera sp.]
MKLSKEKRDQLILVGMATVGAIAGLWFGLISFQRGKLVEATKKAKVAQDKIDQILKVVKDADRVEADLKTAATKLSDIEANMPSGDLYSWMVSSIKQFNVPAYKVDMPQIGIPTVGEVTMMPSFPYEQATVAVAGTAYFYDLGKFLADFENHFPYARIQNLTLDPVTGGASSDEKEKLAFRMEIVTLTKLKTP